MGPRPAITVGGSTVSYAEFVQLINRVEPPVGGVADLAGLDVVGALAAVFAAARTGTVVLVRAADTAPPELPPLPVDALMVAMTSGTSGRPRAVVRSAASWATSFRPFTQLVGIASQDVVLLTGPLHSTLHLFAAVHTLWLGAHLTDDPAAATAAHAVPTMAMTLLADRPRRLRTIVTAGAGLPVGLEARSAALGVRLIEYYGAAELSLVAARVAPEPLRPFPGVDVRVVEGELWAFSPYLATGRVRFGTGRRLETLGEKDGFVSVGDLATVGADGGLTIHGRGNAAVTTGGYTVIAEDVEAAVAALPGVAGVVAVGFPHVRLGQVLTAVLELTDGADIADVRRAARHVLSGAALPRRWEVVDRLPRTAAGKVSRAAALAALDARDQTERSVR